MPSAWFCTVHIIFSSIFMYFLRCALMTSDFHSCSLNFIDFHQFSWNFLKFCNFSETLRQAKLWLQIFPRHLACTISNYTSISCGKPILIKIRTLDRELWSLLYPHYPKNNANIYSTIDPDVQNNIAIRDSSVSLLAMYNDFVMAWQLSSCLSPRQGRPNLRKS